MFGKWPSNSNCILKSKGVREKTWAIKFANIFHYTIIYYKDTMYNFIHRMKLVTFVKIKLGIIIL